MSKKVFNHPIREFNPDNLLEEMTMAKDGEIFILGENRIRNHEGDDTVEVIMAKIIRTVDKSNNTPNTK